MLGVVLQSSLSVCSDATHLRFLPPQASKLPFYLHQSIAGPFRCLVVSTKGASPAIDIAAPNPSNTLISLFHSYGFSEDQVEWIFHKRHHLAAADPEKTIRPKLDYLLSFGYSQLELVTLVHSDPALLGTGLERLIHNMSRLEQLLGSKTLVKRAISCTSRLLRCNYDKCIVPHVEILRIHGVPDKRIAQILLYFPKAIMQKPESTSTVAMELKNLGMDPSSRAFIVGFRAKTVFRQHNWVNRVALYKSFGWSDEDFLSAFKKNPYFMLHSEGKIKKMMNFYVKKLGWDPAFLSEKPLLLDLSLEKRVLPWCAVLSVLASMGLLEWEVSLPILLLMAQKSFEAKYVVRYSKVISVIRKAYDGMLEVNLEALRTWEKRNREMKSEEEY